MKNLFLIFTVCCSVVSFGQDWKDFPIPVTLGDTLQWELQTASDDFNYTSDASPKSAAFSEKWDDFYHNGWTGPGKTVWSRSKSMVEDGILKISSSRLEEDKVSTGCITGKQRVTYPAYVEAYVKTMNSTLASDIWMLSPDDTQEIDILEAYSDISETREPSNKWFGERIHLSHHVFIRKPFKDWQPKTPDTWYYQEGTVWQNDYHRYGVYWKNPWHLEYYIDGVLVKTTSGKEAIDPLYHTNSENPGDMTKDTRTGINKAMDIIINVEDQTWRSINNKGLTPTDEELKITEDHTLKVDWIRVYKPIDKASIKENFGN